MIVKLIKEDPRTRAYNLTVGGLYRTSFTDRPGDENFLIMDGLRGASINSSVFYCKADLFEVIDANPAAGFDPNKPMTPINLAPPTKTKPVNLSHAFCLSMLSLPEHILIWSPIAFLALALWNVFHFFFK